MDWARLSRWAAPWDAIVDDHGNSGSPAWAVVALPFVELFGASPLGQTLLGCLDLVLMAVPFVFLFRAFGGEAAAVGLIVWSLTPASFRAPSPRGPRHLGDDGDRAAQRAI